MQRRQTFLALVVMLISWSLLGGTFVSASEPDLEGTWYGFGNAHGLGGGTFEITFATSSYGALAYTSIPALGLDETPLPATVDQTPEGMTVSIAVPGLELSGIVFTNTITGELTVYLPWGAFSGPWYMERDTGEPTFPGSAPGPTCSDLPGIHCGGIADHCGGLVPFLPEEGPGYLNYPINGETWEDQYRSFIRRDLMQIVKHAAAKVDCKAADWDYGNFEPLGLGDMSEEDGSIPGSSIGYPGHPPGTHEWGLNIDIAYYQLFAPDNRLRAVGVHQPGYLEDAYHLIGDPYGLDVWRTALFIAYLFEHPRMRVVGVDGKIGPVLEDALDDLVGDGWIDYELRESIHLAYEVEDNGWGWFLFHHHHMHVALVPAFDVVATADVTPDTLNSRSQGQYVTALIELVDGFDVAAIDPATVALILDEHTMLHAEPWPVEIGDANENGVPDLTVKFDRQALLDSVDAGAVEITVVGQADWLFFQDVDTIQVIH